MGMYKSIHVVVGVVVDSDDFEEEVGCSPHMVDENYDDIAAYNGGEYQHDEVIVGKPIFDYSLHAARFGNDNDVNLDLQEVLKENRQEVSAKLASELEVYGKTSIYLVGQMI